MFENVEEYVTKHMRNEKGNEVLHVIYLLSDNYQRNELIEIPLGNTEKYDPFVRRADRFLCFQLDNCAKYRRFVLCHAADEDTGAGNSGLYEIIEFLNPETTLAEFQVPEKSAKGANKH
ncbi:hypothetical protein RUND412_000355 [Rhizina undulata]